MGIPVLILGEPGAGKSTSMRFFAEDEVMVLNVAEKPLPFRGKLPKVDKAGYIAIYDELKKNQYKRYVIDDSQYLLSFELFTRAGETGYKKFTDIAVHFYNLIRKASSTSEDTIVYFMHHTQKSDLGIKMKTVGKMLDDQLTVEGLFSIVMMAESENGKYIFRTQTNGNDPVKTPMGMFESKEIENNLKMVDQAIREYWGLN